MIAKLCAWLDHRTGYRHCKEVLLLEHIPGGARWRYVWGSCLAFVFALQAITGILLMVHYSPGDSSAWGSVYFIQYELDFGWLIRGLHHFGSFAMVILLCLHMLQVVVAGAHLPPREFNWWFGLALLGLTLGLAFTGYLLPWDQKGYWATRVATNIIGNIPAVGGFLQKIVVGGTEYGHHTLTHYYALHVGVLPALLVLLLVAHVMVFRKHGVTAPTKASGQGLFWPDQAFKDLVACLVVFAIMMAVTVFGGHGVGQPDPLAEDTAVLDRWAKAGREGRGANLDAPADPAAESYPARPETYFLFLFQILKYFEGDQEIIGTLVLPAGILGLLFLLPLLGYGRLRKFGHLVGILVVVVLLAGIGAFTIGALRDDANNAKLQEEFRLANRQAQRAVQVAAAGIPEEGARYLLRHDPLTRGPKLFEKNCAACHKFSVKDGGQNGFAGFVQGKFSAADLGDYASAEWIQGLLDDPAQDKYFGLTQHKGMKRWKAGVLREWEAEKKRDPQAAKKQIAQEMADFALIARWLADQAQPKTLRTAELEKPGHAAFDNHCSSCHSFQGEGGSDAPDLTDYGSAAWLRFMLMAPGHEKRYAEQKEMPSFRNLDGPAAEVNLLGLKEIDGKSQVNHLSDIDRELIIRWLTRDYRIVFGGREIAAPPQR